LRSELSTSGSKSFHGRKKKILTDNIAKTEEWWSHQPSEAVDTVERVAVMMGIPVSLLGKNYDVLNLLRAMTAALSRTN
jgi:hypothetical protein